MSITTDTTIIQGVRKGLEQVKTLFDNLITDINTEFTSQISALNSKTIVYHNTDAAISKTAGSYGYLSFASGDVKGTINVESGDKVVINASVSFSSSASGTYPQFCLYENSSQIGSVKNAQILTYSSTGENAVMTFNLILTTPTIGASTEYSLRWKKEAGAGTVYARFPNFMVFTIK